MGNLDSSVGTVKGRTTDGCGSILARFKAFFSFRQRPDLLGGGGGGEYYFQWLSVAFFSGLRQSRRVAGHPPPFQCQVAPRFR